MNRIEGQLTNCNKSSNNKRHSVSTFGKGWSLSCTTSHKLAGESLIVHSLHPPLSHSIKVILLVMVQQTVVVRVFRSSFISKTHVYMLTSKGKKLDEYLLVSYFRLDASPPPLAPCDCVTFPTSL